MTNEEIQLIKSCRIRIVGKGEIMAYIAEELSMLGFVEIGNTATIDVGNDHDNGLLIEYTGSGSSQSGDISDIPAIYPFDFIYGAGAIVLFPEDERDFLCKQNLRLWAAEYMSGYCAFWNMEGCDWLHDALPAIMDNRTSEEASKTAAYMCARIAANIAVGRNVKRYPRFYLSRNYSNSWRSV